ncbi:hypothetical protein ALP66_03442, partial [Pseudomonas amygdali pv. photiniae]
QFSRPPRQRRGPTLYRIGVGEQEAIPYMGVCPTEAYRRRKAFLTEIDELEKAIKAGEQVHAFFVGAYPLRSTVENRDGSQFEVYRAELSSIDHLSLVFAEPNQR